MDYDSCDRLRDEACIQQRLIFSSGKRWEVLKVEIEAIAYTLWEEAGRPEGKDFDFWVQAEHVYLEKLRNSDWL